MKLKKWVIVILAIILITCILILAMDFSDLKIFITSKIISLIIIFLISRIFQKYGILEE